MEREETEEYQEDPVERSRERIDFRGQLNKLAFSASTQLASIGMQDSFQDQQVIARSIHTTLRAFYSLAAPIRDTKFNNEWKATLKLNRMRGTPKHLSFQVTAEEIKHYNITTELLLKRMELCMMLLDRKHMLLPIATTGGVIE